MSELLKLQGRVSELTPGLQVRRVLPTALKRSVGPFVFFDHMGPVSLKADTDSDVGGHPHIGLATVSYLFEGSLLHRDSIGSVQLILPGDINWMTAGRGIVHSERVPDDARGQARRLHGLQLWVALPPDLEETEPAFQHVVATDIPTHTDPSGAVVRVLVGQAFGHRSPVNTASPTLYLDVQWPANTTWTLPALADEMAIYSPEHPLQVNGQTVAAQEMAVLPQGAACTVRAGADGVRCVVIGGAPLAQPVRMWWNYVSVDRQRIADAARRWAEGGFDSIPGETHRVPGPFVPF
jgi:redox-sensitive bicupin YhaK (pirin superfamily)